MDRKRYATDLTDEQWNILEPLVPPEKSKGRHRETDMREVVNAILYLDRTGCQWDMLPHDLPPKSTVYDYFAQWRDDGTWQRMLDELRERVRVLAGREATPSAGVVDAQAVKTGGPAARSGTTPASTLRGENGTSSSTRWACCWSSR